MNVIAQSISRIGINYGQQQVSRLGLFGTQQQDGKSGYWRLFYYQLQEAALVEKAPIVKAEKPSAEPVAIQVKAQRKRLPAPVEELEAEPPLPPFLKTPLPNTSEPIFSEANAATVVSMELSILLARYKVNALKYTQKLNVEDEEDIELLLLAA